MLPLNVPKDINKYFFNRTNDFKLINAYLEMLNQDIANQFLITGYRGVGKTYFLKKLLINQPEEILTAYLDLSEVYGSEYGEMTEEEVLKQLLQAINKTLNDKEKTYTKTLRQIKSLFKQLQLKNYDFNDNINIFDIPLPIIKDNYSKLSKFVMELPQKIVDSNDSINGFIIVIDEFQSLKKLKNPDAFFWLMRSYSQKQHNVSYIFTGSISNTSDIINMINGPTGAYGGRMIQINLEPFSKEETYKYITERTNLKFTEDGFDRFYKCTHGMPTYINSFANVLDSLEVYDAKKVKNTFLLKLDQINVIWLTIWGSLNKKEKNIIELLMQYDNLSWKDLSEKLPYSKNTIIKYVDVLVNRGLINHYMDEYSINDMMLKTWLENKKEMSGHYPL